MSASRHRNSRNSPSANFSASARASQGRTKLGIKISDNGYIYEVSNKRQRLLGHISWLLKEQNPLGEKIRRWWKAYLKTA